LLEVAFPETVLIALRWEALVVVIDCDDPDCDEAVAEP
jgi:hypothetical protein